MANHDGSEMRRSRSFTELRDQHWATVEDERIQRKIEEVFCRLEEECDEYRVMQTVAGAVYDGAH